MSVLIENYRGHDIYFDSDNERFSFHFDTGSWNQKQTFSACKKSIDDYVKENEKFEPFIVERLRGRLEQIKIVGIRKDRRFCFDNGGNVKGQVSNYDEPYWYAPNHLNVPIYERLYQIRKEIHELNEKERDIDNSIIKKTLAQIRKEIIK